MISVDEALRLIAHHSRQLQDEQVSLDEANGRIASRDVFAATSQPPLFMSAMDGYAIRSVDLSDDAQFEIIGEVAAGKVFDGAIETGQAVRIFTGAPVPSGCDQVVIQENTERENDHVTVNDTANPGHHIRPAGIDFAVGDKLASAGELLNDRHISLIAAGNVPSVSIAKQPICALFTNGDELAEPGSALGLGQIVNSNHYALTGLITRWGGNPRYLGKAGDSEAAIEAKFADAGQSDVVICVGGASVGDYDYARRVFEQQGGQFYFTKVAVRPGKPTWFGELNGKLVIGLPGNPASAIVTASLFLKPLIKKMTGSVAVPRTYTGLLTRPLRENGPRETYMRAEAMLNEAGHIELCPATNQDSSLLRPFPRCNALIKRVPNAPALEAGEIADFVAFPDDVLMLP